MFAKVIINKPFLNTIESLSYLIPQECNVEIGSIVTVPFRHEIIAGIVIEVLPEELIDQPKLRSIVSVSTKKISQWQITMAQWISIHYCCPLYKAFKGFLTPHQWNGKIETSQKEYMYTLLISKTEAKEYIKKNKRAVKQTIILSSLIKEGMLHSEDLSGYSQTINALLKKNLIQQLPFETFTQEKQLTAQVKHNITAEQQKIIADIEQNPQKAHLIHGISASGKSEIYLQLALETIKNGGQALILTPELPLTHHLYHYFKAYFPQEIALIHSKLSTSERTKIWNQIHTGRIKIVIGSRSALFYPFKNLTLTILDEEHEWSYKSDQAPRYHAREVMYQLPSFFTNPPTTVLASATPSIESYYKAEKKELILHTLDTTIHDTHTTAQIVDMREEFHHNNFSVLSTALQYEIEKRLTKQEKTLIVINRRGFASSVNCRDCGCVIECPTCKNPLTLYKKAHHTLFCHHCSHQEKYHTACTKCGSINIKELGIGTEKVVMELKRKYPSATVVQVDSNTLKTMKNLGELQSTVSEADIIVGTQIIAKGFDIKQVTLSAILLADLELNFPDYQSNERAYQLFMQTRGRSGRHSNGHFIIQTYQADHPVILAATQQKMSTNNYLSFYQQELMMRKLLEYPPVSNIARINVKEEKEHTAKEQVQKITKELNLLRTQKQLHVAHAPDLIYRKKGLYNWHILVRSNEPIHSILKEIKTKGTTIDVSPSSTI